MVEWLGRFDVEPVILDNDSTRPPLLAWYRQPNYAANVAHLGRIERIGEAELRAYAAESLRRIGDATRFRR